VIGVSRSEKEFSRRLFRDLIQRGYDAVPVNPETPELDGRRCFARVQEVTPAVAGAIIMLRPEELEHAVYDCAEAGVKRVWIPLGVSRAPLGVATLLFCAKSGMVVISGFCPYMFLKNAGFVHRFHGFFATRAKTYQASI
jgi:uncharacterized protein